MTHTQAQAFSLSRTHTHTHTHTHTRARTVQGADVNSRDANQQTLLHHLAYTDTEADRIIARMVVGWSDFRLLDATDREGYTAMQWAEVRTLIFTCILCT